MYKRRANSEANPNLDYTRSPNAGNLNQGFQTPGKKQNIITKMLSYKKERENAEEEALMLRNRIQMLQLEDQKTHQKIEETRRKTKEFIEVKLISQRHSIQLQEAKQERMRLEQEQSLRNKQLKDLHMRNKYEAQIRCYEAAKEKAIEMRNQFAIQKEVASQDREVKRKRNEETINRIREGHRELLMKKMNTIEQKISNLVDQYNTKIENEVVQKKQIEYEIEDLEKREIELIKQLQHSKRMQLLQNEELERIREGRRERRIVNKSMDMADQEIPASPMTRPREPCQFRPLSTAPKVRRIKYQY